MMHSFIIAFASLKLVTLLSPLSKVVFQKWQFKYSLAVFAFVKNIFQILGYLDVNSLVECQLVNKYWYRVSNDAKLWKTMCHKPFYRLSAKVRCYSDIDESFSGFKGVTVVRSVYKRY